MSKQPVIRRALLSVSDKTGLIPFARELEKFKVEIISTGGTLRALKQAGIAAKAVEEMTGFPEILEGRVKTLHPKIHGGLLYRRDRKSHEREALKHGILPIDLVVVNLYPFEEVTSQKSVKLETAIENIDIGGPSMLRSAAKNSESVTVICDPGDYERVLEEMKSNHGTVSAPTRQHLGQKVFERTAAYDRAITSFLKRSNHHVREPERSALLPEKIDVTYVKTKELRYGENPHQRAALYTASDRPPRLKYEQLHGKELSFNNILDIEATIDVLREFAEPAACVVKHNNPCGIAESHPVVQALENAIECDAMSAFGGIVGMNQPCHKQEAETALDQLKFFEVFVAPSFDAAALRLLKARQNLRIIATGPLGEGGPYDMRFTKGGLLLQDRDPAVISHLEDLKARLKFVTKAKLKASEIDDLIFAWKCVKVVKSNAIVLAQGRQTVGIGAGQMSRVDSVFIACQKAGYRAEGAFLASDAFFPMPDAIEEAHERKIRAIIQPGGSIRDADIIAVCDLYGIAMAFTGRRHFRH